MIRRLMATGLMALMMLSGIPGAAQAAGAHCIEAQIGTISLKKCLS